MILIFSVENETEDETAEETEEETAEETEEVYRYIAVYTKDHELVESLFIRGIGSVKTNIPPGEYYVKDALGTEWYGEKELFGEDGTYEKMIFNEMEEDDYLTVLEEDYEYKITINPSLHGGESVESEETGWENWD